MKVLQVLVQLLASAAALGAGENGPFEALLIIGTFPRPVQAAAAGDFNRDGKLDLAVVDGTRAVRILLQASTDRLGWRREEFTAGTGLFFVRAVDIDSDGDDDLVASDPGTQGFTLVCRGDGTFEQAEPLPGSEGARWVAAGDWDGDRKVDLATANFETSNVSILRGDGRGGFSLAGTYAAGGRPHVIEALDYDGDGSVDLAVKLSHLGIQPFHGQGDGTFDLLPVIDGLGIDWNIAAGDFNHDGRGDLAVECCGVGISLGDGTYQKTLSFQGGPRSVAIADLNGDGEEDVAQLAPQEGPLNAFLGVGDGTFRGPVSLGNTALDVLLLAADLDRDGHSDLLAAETATASLTVIWGRGGDRFLELGYPVSGFGSSGHASAADLNRNGLPDLFLPSSTEPRVLVFLDPKFPSGPPASLAIRTAKPYTALVVADLDADGVPDLAGVNRAAGTALLALLDVSGKVRRQAELPAGVLPSALAVGRLDAGESPDLAVLCPGSSHIAVFLNQGDGSFAAAGTVPTLEKATRLAAADLDGDGRQDLAVLSNREVAVHRRLGEGLFSAPTNLKSDPLGTFSDLKADDLDRDGVEDLAVLDAAHGTLVLFHGKKGGEPSAWTSLEVGSFPATIAIGDLDGDGLPDLTTANADGQSVSVLRNLGAGGFAGRRDFWIGFSRPSHLLADLNGDGALDLVAFKGTAALVLPGRPRAAFPGRFRRGDVDGDGLLKVNDPVQVLGRLFLGGAALPCEDAADANDDGGVDLADPIAILNRLFLGGEMLPPPGPADCGMDPTADGLGVCGGECR